MQFYSTKIWDKLSVSIDYVECTLYTGSKGDFITCNHSKKIKGLQIHKNSHFIISKLVR